jgi:CO/xanthine dehydrogenase Mo-binding subunit
MSMGFADDLSEPGMLYLRPILSTIPKGNIASIRYPDQGPDLFLYKESDIPGAKSMEIYGEQMPVLSGSEVHYEGEAICLILGETPEVLEEAEKQIIIDYESNYTLEDFDHPRQEQFFEETVLKRGSAEKAFATAHQIVEGEYLQQDPIRDAMAPIGALAVEKEGVLEIKVSSLWPEQVKKSVSEILDIPQTMIRIKPVNSFPTDGEKIMLPSLIAVWAALGCRLTGRAVKVAWDVPPTPLPFLRSPRSRIAFQTALDEKGNVVGENIDASIDLGAFSFLSKEMLTRLVIGIAGSRYTPNTLIRARGVRTSLSPTRLRCGFGIIPGLFSREVHEARIAQLLGKDPADRKLEAADKKRIPTGGSLKRRSDRLLIQQVCSASDFHRKHAAYQLMKKRPAIPGRGGIFRGIGIASGFTGDGFTAKPAGREPWSVSVLLDKNDKLTIQTRAGAFPGSVKALWKHRAGEILGINPELIDIDPIWQDLGGNGPLVCGQRLSVTTTLVEQCCNAIKRQRFNVPLPINVRKNFRSPSQAVWDREKLKGTPFHRLTWGAMVVEVDLDPFSWQPSIRGIWCAIDCGNVYDRKEASSAVRTAITRSLRRCTNGDLLISRRAREAGIFAETEQLSMYPIEISFSENRTAQPSGVAQIPGALFPSAFVSAVSQATGIYLDTLPITPELIHSFMVKGEEE